MIAESKNRAVLSEVTVSENPLRANNLIVSVLDFVLGTPPKELSWPRFEWYSLIIITE
jgi:hypothetical protein